MIKNNTMASKVFNIGNYIFLTLITISFILPFIYMFSVSVSNPVDVALYRVGLFPKGFRLRSYITLFENDILLISYWNSIRYTVIGTVIALVIGSITAFPLSLNKFKYKTFFIIIFTITMFFNGGLIPGFLNIKNLGMIDTIWAMVLPPAFAFWNIIIIRTNFQAVPIELYESAHVDGANDWVILFRIVLPLSKAVLATIALFVSVYIWNAFFPALLYLNSPEKQPLTILLKRILIANQSLDNTQIAEQTVDPLVYIGNLTSLRMATIFVTIGPIVLVYPFAQKYFIRGMLIGSVKG